MQASRLGYRAVGVPGTVAGMALALKTYGKLKLAEVMAPAIRLADGFTISDKLATSLHDSPEATRPIRPQQTYFPERRKALSGR